MVTFQHQKSGVYTVHDERGEYIGRVEPVPYEWAFIPLPPAIGAAGVWMGQTPQDCVEQWLHAQLRKGMSSYDR